MNISSTYEKNADVVLYEGDTLDFLRSLPKQSVKLIVTSPPYNLGKKYEKRSSVETYLSFQQLVIQECVRILQDDGSICWQVGNYVENGEIIPLDILLYPIFTALNLKMRNRIIWQFGHGLHCSKRFSGRYEVITWFTKTDKYLFNVDAIRVPQKYAQKKYFKGPKKGQLSGNPLGKNPGDIWDIPNVKANHVEKTTHPCQFPVELVERLVLSMTNEGDWVLDPFMGVGSTAIAALMHNRKAAGAEIMPEYIQTAKDRLNMALTGELRIRPIERPVHDPTNPKVHIPPKYIKVGVGDLQPVLLEKSSDYKAGGTSS
jgi:adenine-specific DNA-methyltransferase